MSQRLLVFVLDYLLCGQSIQLLDVRRNKRVKSDQKLVLWQGGEEEAESLHQPHALAALHTHTSYMTVGALVCTNIWSSCPLCAHLVDLFHQCVLQKAAMVN